jgi:phosphoribosylformylglycinamidine synthase subunit PurQ / glutaminase
MSQPNVLIIRAPGTNCDMETAFAFEQAGATAEVLHINRVLDRPALFERFQILCIPGGFSFGDDIAAGRIFGNLMQHHLAEQLEKFKEDGKLILGICNGFQVLMKSPVLLESDREKGPAVTLALNDSGRYEDRWVQLEVKSSKCVFLKGIERMYLPVAHAEGKFVARDDETLRQLDSVGQLALRYVSQTADGSGPVRFPDNPNGSQADVAGICDSTGRVLGLMPHPERHIDPTQHPRWTRDEASSAGDGLQIFVNAVQYFS